MCYNIDEGYLCGDIVVNILVLINFSMWYLNVEFILFLCF